MVMRSEGLSAEAGVSVLGSSSSDTGEGGTGLSPGPPRLAPTAPRPTSQTALAPT